MVRDWASFLEPPPILANIDKISSNTCDYVYFKHEFHDFFKIPPIFIFIFILFAS